MIHLKPFIALSILLLMPLTAAGEAMFDFSTQADPEQPFDESFEEDTNNLEWVAEVSLRQDFVRSLPRRVEKDFDRTLLRARAGLLWASDFVEIGLSAKLNQSTDNNADPRRNLDNELADDESIDDAFIAFRMFDTGLIKLGQAELPLILSEAVWDPDLRPRGITLQHAFSLSDYNSLEVTLGSYDVNHALNSDAELDAVQVSLFLAEGAPVSYSGQLSYLAFSDLDSLISNGIARTNSQTLGKLGEEFDLIDLQLGVTLATFEKPVRLGLDLIKNTQADKGDGARFEFVYGESQDQPGLELGFATQRIQQDAVLAAFSDDDWWFTSNLRGTTVWAAYGFSESLRVRFAAFNERRDDQLINNRRALVDLRWSF